MLAKTRLYLIDLEAIRRLILYQKNIVAVESERPNQQRDLQRRKNTW
jgi:hypothetical protein